MSQNRRIGLEGRGSSCILLCVVHRYTLPMHRQSTVQPLGKWRRACTSMYIVEHSSKSALPPPVDTYSHKRRDLRLSARCQCCRVSHVQHHVTQCHGRLVECSCCVHYALLQLTYGTAVLFCTDCSFACCCRWRCLADRCAAAAVRHGQRDPSVQAAVGRARPHGGSRVSFHKFAQLCIYIRADGPV